MRRFRVNDLDGIHDVTDAEILETYYPWWASEMRRLGRDHIISEEACIEDWVVVHWAWEIFEPAKD